MNRHKMILDSIIDMFLNCKMRHHYMIFTNDYNNRERIIKYLVSQLKANEDISMKYSHTVFAINNLKTGAIFRIMQPNINTRGLRSFLSLYEDACPKEVVDTIISPISFNLVSFNIDYALMEVKI